MKYQIGDSVLLIDLEGGTWIFKIIDITDKYYILDGHPNDPDGPIHSGFVTNTSPSAQEGIIAFEKENFNAPKIINKKDLKEIFDYEEKTKI